MQTSSVSESEMLPFHSEAFAIEGLHEGVDAMASAETFKGYRPGQGYEFLRKAISEYYARNGAED